MARPSQPYRRPRPVLRFLGVSTAAGVIVAGMVLPAAGALALGARNASQSFESLPSVLDTPPLPQRSLILAADGSKIAEFFYQNRAAAPLNAIAPIMRQAVVAIEDSRYYDHGGVDVRGALRALQRNTSSGGVREGGSTITQQYVKQTLIENAVDDKARAEASARTIARKLREARLAVALEQKYSKDEILERYLNTVYFGDRAYGVQAAAGQYFGKSASQLSLVEAATLAGIIQQPVAYDPTRNPKKSETRRNVVLTRMQQLGVITPQQAAQAIATPLPKTLRITERPNGCSTSYAPFFCDYVVRMIKIDPAFGKSSADREALLKRGGLTIKTTLDPALQRTAQKAVDEAIPPTDGSKKATVSVSVEPGTGAIRAMAQNRKWGVSGINGYTTVNFAVDTKYGGALGAQAGSTFKVFTLATALDQGMSIKTTLRSPGTKTFVGFKSCKNGRELKPYTLSNSTSSGTFDMRRATANSVNTYFVGLELKTGICAVADMAESLGVRQATGDPLQRFASLTLGTNAVSPLDMANAYASFAARGVHCTPLPFAAITDREGTSVATPPANCQQVVKQPVADAVNQLLTAVITDGTGKAMDLGRPAAGKTGTIENNGAVWFIGHTPQMATAVWVGDPRGGQRYPIRDVTINGKYISKGFGSTIAGPIWKRVMTAAVKGKPVLQFPQPDPSVIAGLPTTVPDVRGLQISEAIAAMQTAGLRAELAQYRVPSSLYPEGTIVYSSPGAGRRTESGRIVKLTISDGPPPIAVYTPPPVYGVPQPQQPGNGIVVTPPPANRPNVPVAPR